jgi:uncharacterized protein (TIGR02145 family)
MRRLSLLITAISFLLILENQAQTITDFDGNVYNTVTIGTQLWMKENLEVTHYNNGDLISNVSNNTAWSNLTSGARTYYNNDSLTNSLIYGALYNWHTVVDNRKLCPNNWHVPSNSEWNILYNYLDETIDTTALGYLGTDAGGQLKSVGTTYWNSPNTGATDISEFSALPGGKREVSGTYNYLRDAGGWWSSTESSTTHAFMRDLGNSTAQASANALQKKSGFSVRCISDVIVTRLGETNSKKDIHIYPNPAIDHVTIDFVRDNSCKVNIYNLLGACVIQSDLSANQNIINISSLPPGLYIFEFVGADWFIQKMIIKE